MVWPHNTISLASSCDVHWLFIILQVKTLQQHNIIHTQFHTSNVTQFLYHGKILDKNDKYFVIHKNSFKFSVVHPIHI